MYTNADKQAYWGQKTQNADKAAKHTRQMEQQYAAEIDHAYRTTVLYDTEQLCNLTLNGNRCHMTPADNISVVPLDSVSAIFAYAATRKPQERMAVLNFASYKNPGGRFMDGSMAQEEALCHASYLYNVLGRFRNSYYNWNEQHKNRALYTDRALYSPGIRFFRNEEESAVCDVLTCACPNKTAAQKYQNISDKENALALASRIRFLIQVAVAEHVDTLILGAYGCGVFGQDPKEVAFWFNSCLKDFKFGKVVFAIPNTGAGARNYWPFIEAFDHKHYP